MTSQEPLATVVCKPFVSKSAVVIQHWPIRTITNDITSILVGHLQIFKFFHWQMTFKPQYDRKQKLFPLFLFFIIIITLINLGIS